MRMRDGAERARPRRVMVKNILQDQLEGKRETRDCACRIEKECEEEESMTSNMWFMGRWLAVPASLNTAVAGTRQHGGKQETKTNGRSDTEKKHGYSHALCMVLFGALLGQHVAHLLCLGFCMASECGRLFAIGLHPDLQKRICWHQLLFGTYR